MLHGLMGNEEKKNFKQQVLDATDFQPNLPEKSLHHPGIIFLSTTRRETLQNMMYHFTFELRASHFRTHRPPFFFPHYAQNKLIIIASARHASRRLRDAELGYVKCKFD